MLPFLKIKKEVPSAGIIQKHRAPDIEIDEEVDNNKDEDMSGAAIEDCAKDILKAIEAKDHKAIASAIADAFTILDSQPHEEGPHVSPHSYDAQNAIAAKGND